MNLTLAPPELKIPEPERKVQGVRPPSDGIECHPHDHFVALVASMLKQWPRPEWLDVGCGWHFDWPWKAERERELVENANVVGLDPDVTAIRKHRSIQRRTVGTVEMLPFQSESFHLVTANVVVEHLKYPSLAFAEIFRVLKPGGSFVFRTPSARSYFVRIARRLPQGMKVWLARQLESREPEDVYPAHYRANTAEEVKEICKVVGFREVNVNVTMARGFLVNKAPGLARMERGLARALNMTEGNLIVEARK
jgi:ubiquinone/menaquinone biosynthesis C-methylase UbiE